MNTGNYISFFHGYHFLPFFFTCTCPVAKYMCILLTKHVFCVRKSVHIYVCGTFMCEYGRECSSPCKHTTMKSKPHHL